MAQNGYNAVVYHHHLTHQQFTLAAIDDMIARGKQQGWAGLRRAALAERVVMEKVQHSLQAVISASIERAIFIFDQIIGTD